VWSIVIFLRHSPPVYDTQLSMSANATPLSVDTLRRPPTRLPIPGDAPSLYDAARGRAWIARGMIGQSVSELQQMLNTRGYEVIVDGKFSAETERAVRAFQRDHGACLDGVVGPETMGYLSGCYHHADELKADGIDRVPPGACRARSSSITLAPEGLSDRDKFEHYAQIVRENGGTVNPKGRATVLGLRGMSRDGERHDTGSTRRYDDTFVVLTLDGRVRELRGATHPGQRTSTMSPDASGDGRADVGMIRPGNYEVVPNGAHGGNACFHVRTQGGSGRLPGWRDTNQDGVFSDDERLASEQRGDVLTGVLFHPGGETAPKSIGCQTMPPTEYQRFVDMIGGPTAAFSYTLVDAY
jgi:hypothetical protein